MTSYTIHWFRQDLRINDNPALYAAAQNGNVIPIYILDDDNAGSDRLGAASRVWLHHSLTKLNKALEQKLHIFCGSADKILSKLIDQHNISAVYWNRCYEPWRIARDTKIKQMLNDKSIATRSFNSALLWEPWDICKPDGTPYRVFTPFYRKACLNVLSPRTPLPKPNKQSLKLIKLSNCKDKNIESLNLLPENIRWDKKLIPHWNIGETGAQKRLNDFLDKGIQNYKKGRNFPAQSYVSRLSPHLHFGEISPQQLWQAVRTKGDDDNTDYFLSELGWREFSYHLLYHNPQLPRQNLQKKFDHFPWIENSNALKCWQKGKTGIPIVDAGMRELWQTGYMHNRARMIVGSFLVKNLRLHWHHGERWFWDCLVDADLANNSASWQWIAGCGADAAPYFRIFNPVTQGQKFDAEGTYTRQFVPELAKLPNKYLFNPWEAPKSELKEAGVILGTTYPYPIVDLRQSRQKALQAFQSLKDSQP